MKHFYIFLNTVGSLVVLAALVVLPTVATVAVVTITYHVVSKLWA